MKLDIKPGLYDDFLVKIFIDEKYIATALIDNISWNSDSSALVFNHIITDEQESFNYNEFEKTLEQMIYSLFLIPKDGD